MKATLEDIVIEARELFRERGYAGASMQDLADRVGLKKPSLYARFPNKEALVSDVLALTIAETFAGSSEGEAWRTAYERVVRRIAAVLTDRKRCVGFHLAYGMSADTPAAAAAVRGFFTAMRDRIAGILRPAVDAKRADEIAADTLIRLEGATLWLATMDDAGPMRRSVAALLAEADLLAGPGQGTARR